MLGERAYEPLFAFFDGLSRSATPARRWDRLVAMHLLLMAFMRRTGFDAMHQISDQELIGAARQMCDPRPSRRSRRA